MNSISDEKNRPERCLASHQEQFRAHLRLMELNGLAGLRKHLEENERTSRVSGESFTEIW